MSKYPDDGAPVLRAKRLKRKNLTFAGDVIIDGDFDSSGDVFIGGNLTVGGDCHMRHLVCLGDIKVGGNLFFCHADMRGTISCKGDVSGNGLFMKTAIDQIPIKEPVTKSVKAALTLAAQRSERWEDPSGNFQVEMGLDVGGALEVDTEWLKEDASLHLKFFKCCRIIRMENLSLKCSD